MINFNVRQIIGGVLLSLLLSAVAQADMLYHVSVDTSALSGGTGYVDLQLNPADADAPSVTALLSGFGGSITLLPEVTNEGDVSGVLPGSLTLVNSTAFNDVFQSVLFGSSFAFDVNFSGDFLTSASNLGSSFALSLYAADGTTPLLTTDGNGTVLTMDLVPGGSVTSTAFAADAVGSPSVVNVAPVPLPAALWLLLGGLGVLPWRGRKAV